MEKRELICIGCPMGCPLTVTMEGGEVVEVKGNTCPKGDTYAHKEVTNPTRIVTSTVMVSGGKVPTYSTTVTNVYRWGHGVQLPSTGSPARMLYILCGSGIMLFSLVYGFVSRRKRERRTK
jgi:hypothetical protein